MLPDGYSVRAPTTDDMRAVLDLMIACDLAEYGDVDVDMETLRADWRASNFNLSRDAWLVVAPDGQIVGYEDARLVEQDADIEVDGCVHPAHCGRGIGTALLRLAEARARAFIPPLPEDAQVNEAAHRLFENEGYTTIRHYWRMEIEMDEPPPAPMLPNGIAIRTFARGHDERATYEAVEEAFADHWGHVRPPFEEWLRAKVERADFDPDLWFLALDGGEVAGVSLCRYRAANPWVGGLGVRRAWRGRGLGMALLLHSFGAFYRRGQRRVGLGVDAHNPTGATRLYERAGMRMTRWYPLYEKAMRPSPPTPLPKKGEGRLCDSRIVVNVSDG